MKMMQRWSQWIVAAAALALLGCKEADSAPKGVARGGGVRESELVKGADGLARLEEGVEAAFENIAESTGRAWKEIRDVMRSEGRYHVETY